MADMVPYVVRAGDYLSRIANSRGFDPKEVWEHPKNEELRKRRHNPEVLAAGDILYIPNPDPTRLKLKVGSSNSFRAKLPTVKLKLAVTGPAGEPLANKQYWVDGEAAGSTDGDGNVQIEVAPTQPSVSLRVEGASHTYLVRVANLDPIDTESGVRQRLLNLRYLPENSPLVTGEHVKEALARFQSAQGLEATGEPDQSTKDALLSAHGS
ncbi:MAG: peptidoglycan-binding domain-containing protein [Polyangiaceae bacterium]